MALGTSWWRLYDLFKAIYLERGYQKRSVAQLILEKNLFGLEIDGRAAQLTGFALMMKGRADDRRFFERGVKPNVMALVESTGFDAERLAQRVKLVDYGLVDSDLTELKQLFEHASTFGSLIQVPDGLSAELPALKQLSEATSQDLFVSDALKRLRLLVRQAELLAGQYERRGSESAVYGKQGNEFPGEEVRQGSLSRCQERPLRLLHRAWLHTGEGCRLQRHGHHAELDVPVVVRKDARADAAGGRPSGRWRTLARGLSEASRAR